ncbi:uncharacterized protein GIQ15_05002 [Arthroderma uncinatum]|uniref:uncharacterized protein n=1 Tax=Arthroderma uncinatum TaxID=74035 RepID=UPI00144A99A7|nr:uncharacterized protein GIQ15_05002 [Arthroderma uncinatum]KAF3482243.1 hypothetical protein GIQ15_05002 [Arthroderma uncinatum]
MDANAFIIIYIAYLHCSGGFPYYYFKWEIAFYNSVHDISYAIRHSLTTRNPIWGWVIYRCSYKDEKLWTNVLSEWNQAVDRSRAEQILPSMDMKIVEDPSLERASKEAICERHYAWAGSVGGTAGIANCRNLWPPPRYQFAVYVDEGSLKSVKNHPGPPRRKGKRAYANLLHVTNHMNKGSPGASWPGRPMVKEQWWMRVELDKLPVYAYGTLFDPANWYGYYKKPPQVWRYFD